MALDRAIQVCREQRSAPPTLRLYRWARPTVSLGRFQALQTIDVQYCADSGIDVVRRFTGGRGVLHDDEVTYAAVCGVDDGVPRGVAASYRYLCAALVQAYRALGVDAELTERDRGHAGTGACYLQTTRADLSASHAKLSGSAQVWHGSTVLQHGSLVISRDAHREAKAFGLGEEHRAQLARSTVSLDDLTSNPVGWSEVVAAAIEGFERALGVVLVPGELDALEAGTAAMLLRETDVSNAVGCDVRT
jgi:lipoate-protein ligase A